MDLWKTLDFVRVGDAIDISAYDVGAVPLLRDVLSSGEGHLSDLYMDGVVKQDADGEAELPSIIDKYSKYLAEKGGRLIYRSLSSGRSIFLWKDGIVEINVSGTTYINVRGMSQDEKLIKDIQDYFDTQWAPPELAGQIYAVMRQGPHLTLSPLGNAGIPLVAGNYTPRVMEDYKAAIKDLQSEYPSGRIVIMRGSPGTGKTHLIRAMLLEVPDAMFVLISPEMITNLAGPELLPLLISQRSGTGPIVLVLEDADKCLVSRDKDNINSIQALLNLGDGILGSLLDLRIVATTNAQELHMEEAMLRKGRLSKMLEVGHLDRETARTIFWRLLPRHQLPEELNRKASSFKMTLADTYALARQYGWLPEARKVQPQEDSDESKSYIP